MTAQEALAAALHDNDDTCNANQYVPFAECATPEWDLKHADEVISSLRAAGWRIERDPAGTIPLTLAPTPPDALDVEALYRALLAVENHGAPIVATDYLAVAAAYTAEVK